jgi:hypothetical protein
MRLRKNVSWQCRNEKEGVYVAKDISIRGKPCSEGEDKYYINYSLDVLILTCAVLRALP